MTSQPATTINLFAHTNRENVALSVLIVAVCLVGPLVVLAVSRAIALCLRSRAVRRRAEKEQIYFDAIRLES